jgi:hypothetical protein
MACAMQLCPQKSLTSKENAAEKSTLPIFRRTRANPTIVIYNARVVKIYNATIKPSAL